MASSAHRLRILCLHGYTQNAAVFSKRTGVLRKHLKGKADLVYISAPHAPDSYVASPDMDPAEEGQRAWWNMTDSPTGPVYSGFDAGLAHVASALDAQGPFDGILGFSQGAAMAALAALRVPHPSLKFVICVSGFVSRDPAHAPWYEPAGGCTVPSLHVWGTADAWVPPAKSMELARAFASPTVFEHGGAHYVPMDAAGKAAVADFLAPFLDGGKM
ncbi:Ovarian cancer-associated protein 2 [Blastocladiella emersonii ATCC 22665]|nr:Ovarian cancer-associated protein 2 [Blastocladiella emersonii ATCC 22665]